MSATVQEALRRVQRMLLSDASVTPAAAYAELAPTLRTAAERLELSKSIDAELARGTMRPAGSGSTKQIGGLN